MKPLTEYQHVVWDWNGTLFDDVHLCVDVMNGVLSRRNMPEMTVAHYQRIFDFPVIEYYRTLGFDFEQESFEVVGTEFIHRYEERRHEGALFDGVEGLLSRLREAGVALSVLSAYQQSTLDELVAYFEIEQYFERLVGLDNHYAHGKQDNGVAWMKEIPHEPGDVVLIGDTLHDVDVARAMEVDCILVGSGHQDRERLAKAGVPMVDAVNRLVV